MPPSTRHVQAEWDKHLYNIAAVQEKQMCRKRNIINIRKHRSPFKKRNHRTTMTLFFQVHLSTPDSWAGEAQDQSRRLLQPTPALALSDHRLCDEGASRRGVSEESMRALVAEHRQAIAPSVSFHPNYDVGNCDISRQYCGVIKLVSPGIGISSHKYYWGILWKGGRE